MTEPATIKYTGGASWIELSDGSNTKAVVLKNYRNAVEYFAYLCQKFGWNPEKDGVILSHSEGHARGYATNHADVEHIWKKYGLTMDQFRKDVKAAMAGGAISVSGSPAVTDTGAQGVKALSGTVTVIYTGSDGLNVRTTPSFTSGNAKKVVKMAQPSRLPEFPKTKMVPDQRRRGSGLYNSRSGLCFIQGNTGTEGKHSGNRLFQSKKRLEGRGKPDRSL